MPVRDGDLRRRRCFRAHRQRGRSLTPPDGERDRRLRSIPLISFWLEPLRAAVGFLTVLPIGRSISPGQPSGQRAVSNSRAFFPFVGLLLGLVLAVVEFAVAPIFPIYLTAGVLLLVMVITTRGLHLDGLMDVCDSLFGGYTKERRLEIMKDPHVGAFGVVAGSMLILLKFAALLSLLDPRFTIGGGWIGYSDLAALRAAAFDVTTQARSWRCCCSPPCPAGPWWSASALSHTSGNRASVRPSTKATPNSPPLRQLSRRWPRRWSWAASEALVFSPGSPCWPWPPVGL